MEIIYNEKKTLDGVFYCFQCRNALLLHALFSVWMFDSLEQNTQFVECTWFDDIENKSGEESIRNETNCATTQWQTTNVCRGRARTNDDVQIEEVIKIFFINKEKKNRNEWNEINKLWKKMATTMMTTATTTTLSSHERTIFVQCARSRAHTAIVEFINGITADIPYNFISIFFFHIRK